jgi:hypothetical protein
MTLAAARLYVSVRPARCSMEKRPSRAIRSRTRFIADRTLRAPRCARGRSGVVTSDCELPSTVPGTRARAPAVGARRYERACGARRAATNTRRQERPARPLFGIPGRAPFSSSQYSNAKHVMNGPHGNGPASAHAVASITSASTATSISIAASEPSMAPSSAVSGIAASKATEEVEPPHAAKTTVPATVVVAQRMHGTSRVRFKRALPRGMLTPLAIDVAPQCFAIRRGLRTRPHSFRSPVRRRTIPRRRSPRGGGLAASRPNERRAQGGDRVGADAALDGQAWRGQRRGARDRNAAA